MQFGIVIPSRNEKQNIRDCLDSLSEFITHGDPVIVVDASSDDQTSSIIAQSGVRVLASSFSARGLAAAEGVKQLLADYPAVEIIILGHADMRFPQTARETLCAALERYPEAAGGCFGHRIHADSFPFRLLEWGNRFRAKYLQIPYGDQAQFFRPQIVNSCGGFPQQEYLEDVELSLRMKKSGKLLYLDCPVTVSSRHWKKGILRTTLRNWRIASHYILTGKIHDLCRELSR